MYVKRNYGFWMTFNWSKQPFIIGAAYTAMIFVMNVFFEMTISLPWQPISVIGIAVAFYPGFKNNSSYDRTWEARKIWGAIVNHCRTFATAVISFLGDVHDGTQKELIFRHLAWITALRYQLRLSREWEHTTERIVRAYVPTVCEAYFDRMNPELLRYISEEELDSLTSASNVAAHVLLNQSKVLRGLHAKGSLSDYKYVRLQEIIGWLYDEQGKCERIKNFPFPRQYMLTTLSLTFIFAVLIPFGMNDIFAAYGKNDLAVNSFFCTDYLGIFSDGANRGSF
jgi:ion channel-forming bestrophin family protein